MRFSIITISLNAEKFIRETIESVMMQSFKDFEHIIWDGGSTDNTLSIIAMYPNVKLVTGLDSGISDAMNKGAQYASGEYILHLHADDRLSNVNVLSELDQFIRNNNHPEWIYGRANFISEDGAVRKTTELVPFDAKRLRKYNTITHPSVLLSKALFMDSKGFRTDLKYCMDYELWLRLAKNKVAVPTTIIISDFRGHSGSVSTRETINVANEAYMVRNEYVENLWERFRSFRTWKSRCKKIKS